MKRCGLVVLTAFLLTGCFFAGKPESVSQESREKTFMERMAEKRLEEIRKTGRIRVAVASDLPPWSASDSKNNPVGLQLDFLKKFCEKRKLTPILLPLPGKALPAFVRSGKADLAVAPWTEKQVESLSLVPVVPNRPFIGKFLILRVNPFPESLEEVLEGTSPIGALNRENARKVIPAPRHVVCFENGDYAAAALKEGRVRFLYLTEPEYKNAKLLHDPVFAELPWSRDPAIYYFAVSGPMGPSFQEFLNETEKPH